MSREMSPMHVNLMKHLCGHAFSTEDFCLSTITVSRHRHDISYFSTLFNVTSWAWDVGPSANINLLRSLPCAFGGQLTQWAFVLVTLFFFLVHRADETQPGRNSCLCHGQLHLSINLNSIMSLLR